MQTVCIVKGNSNWAINNANAECVHDLKVKTWQLIQLEIYASCLLIEWQRGSTG